MSGKAHNTRVTYGEIPVPKEFVGKPTAELLWKDTIKTRPTAYWQILDLYTLRRIIRCFMQVEQLDKQLEKDGYTVVTDSGRVLPNPLFTIRSRLEQQAVQMLSKMALTPMARFSKTGADDQDKLGRKQIKEHERQKVIDADDDDLLAGASGAVLARAARYDDD